MGWVVNATPRPQYPRAITKTNTNMREPVTPCQRFSFTPRGLALRSTLEELKFSLGTFTAGRAEGN